MASTRPKFCTKPVQELSGGVSGRLSWSHYRALADRHPELAGPPPPFPVSRRKTGPPSVAQRVRGTLAAMTRAFHHHDPSRPLPAVDEHLVMPGSGFEILDGKVFEVPPALEPHAERNSKLAALLEAHVRDEFNVAVDMLTRTDRLNDFAPDASVYPRARHPETGGRQLEQLAFEIVSTETMGHAALKAAKLIERGVRRVFALDIEGLGVEVTEARQTDLAGRDLAGLDALRAHLRAHRVWP